MIPTDLSQNKQNQILIADLSQKNKLNITNMWFLVNILTYTGKHLNIPVVNNW